MKTHYRLEIEKGQSVHVMAAQPPKQAKGCIVFSHGFSVSGFESHRLFIHIAAEAIRQGWACILFDYRGSGYSDLSFEEMTLDTEIRDLHCVLDASLSSYNPGLPHVVWGCSLGSAVAMLTVGTRDDVSAVVLWSLSSDLYNRYKKKLGEDIQTVGYTYISKGDKVSLAFLESMRNKDVENALHLSRANKLFLHGIDDPVASADLSVAAHAASANPKALHLVEGGVHGFKLQPQLETTAINYSLSWLDHCGLWD